MYIVCEYPSNYARNDYNIVFKYIPEYYVYRMLYCSSAEHILVSRPRPAIRTWYRAKTLTFCYIL